VLMNRIRSFGIPLNTNHPGILRPEYSPYVVVWGRFLMLL